MSDRLALLHYFLNREDRKERKERQVWATPTVWRALADAVKTGRLPLPRAPKAQVLL